VTVVLAASVIAHVVVVAVVQPVHEENALPLDVPGAVRVIAVPELYVRVKLVVPLLALLLSAGDTPMATPLEGLVESTVSVYVVEAGTA